LDRSDLERIARVALKEMGVTYAGLTLTEDAARPDQWLLDVRGSSGPNQIRIRCGAGTTPQFVREQIFQQMA
jgi:hypothetical protein